MKLFRLIFLLFICKFSQAQVDLAQVSQKSIAYEINSATTSADSLIAIAEKEQTNVEYSKLTKTGIVLLGVGGLLTTTGIILGITQGGFSYTYSNVNGDVSESGTPAQGAAGVMVCCGIPTMIGGLVCTLLGQKK